MEVEQILRNFGLILVAGLLAQFVATLLLQATTAGWLARRLGLIEDPNPATPA